MKNIVILSLLFLAFSSCKQNQEVEIGQKTTMEVNPVFNAGKVLLGEEIQAVFEVTNTGDYPLIFSDITPSCSCTLAEKPEEPIQPGEKGVIKANIATEKTGVGSISKTVTVVSNTEPSVTPLKIEAVVYRK